MKSQEQEFQSLQIVRDFNECNAIYRLYCLNHGLVPKVANPVLSGSQQSFTLNNGDHCFARMEQSQNGEWSVDLREDVPGIPGHERFSPRGASQKNRRS